MENKAMTQREFFTAIINSDVAEHLKDYAQTQIEKLDKRNATRSSKPNKTQLENEGIKKDILETLGENGGMLASDIAKALDISTNKVASLCKQLIDDGKITVTEVKVPKRGKVRQYSVVGEVIEVEESEE